jgi:hypothetical protein
VYSGPNEPKSPEKKWAFFEKAYHLEDLQCHRAAAAFVYNAFSELSQVHALFRLA